MTDAFEIENLPPLREVIRTHNLRAEKALGQNFLLDLNLTAKIAKTAKTIDRGTVFEIGPGPGGLTRAILMAGAPHVIAIEYDMRAVDALSSLREASGGRLDVVAGDALKTDLSTLAKQHGGAEPFKIVANLPYNIATPLFVRWLEEIHHDKNRYDELVLMFQKEVAQRIVATPGTKAYGRLSILSQWLCDAKIAFDVPASAFIPPPKVTSSIVRMVPRKSADQTIPFNIMERLTAAAFGQRRKMIRGSMKDYMPQIEACGIDPTLRAEDLSVMNFVALGEAMVKGLP